MSGVSEELFDDWKTQAHVLGAPDGQPVQRVVPDHVRDGRERAAELAEDEAPGLAALLDPHVHESSGAPETL